MQREEFPKTAGEGTAFAPVQPMSADSRDSPSKAGSQGPADPTRVQSDSMLELLRDLTEAINAGKNLDEILDTVYERLRSHIPYDRIGVALVDAVRNRLVLVAVRTQGPTALRVGYTGPIQGSTLERILTTGRPRILNDLEEYLREKPESASTRLMIQEGMRSSLTLPLIVRGRPVGVMFFSSRAPGVYRDEHVGFLRLISGHLAITVEKTLLLKELKDKSDYLENLLRNSADAIVVFDRDNVIRSWNRGAERIFGHTEAEVVGKHASILDPPESPGDVDRLARLVAERGYVQGYETSRMTKDGRRLEVSVTSTAIFDEHGRYAGRSAILRDLTPIRRLQEEIAEKRSLAAVGELAASVAHEIKNPLAGISGAVQILARSFPPGDRRRTISQELLQQVARLDATVRDLLIYARPWRPTPAPVDLSELVGTVLGRLPLDGIRVLRDLPDRCVIEGDSALLEHMFVNLFQNAADAMPQGGALTVRVRENGGHARVEIADTGIGISAAHRERLFKPFFSTKARGTGLGLAISKKVIDAHRGSIEIESEPGRGTLVRVTLPRRFSD